MQSTRLCSVDSCDRTKFANGYCKSHNQRVSKTGSPYRPCKACGKELGLEVNQAQRLCEGCKIYCTVSGCGRPAASKGLCSMHSRRLKKTGSIYRQCSICSSHLSEEIPCQQRRCDKCDNCIIDGCSKPIVSNAMCATHSSRKIYSGVAARYCESCRKELPSGTNKSRTLCINCDKCSAEECAKPSYKTGLCRRHYYRVKEMGDIIRPCMGCGKDLPVILDGRVKYCNDDCRDRCKADSCENPARSKGWCERHFAIVKTYGYLPTLDFKCSDCGKFVSRSHAEVGHWYNQSMCEDCLSIGRRRDHQWFRQEVMTGQVPAICGICNCEIDLELRYPHPRSLTVDHIVPVSKGGTSKRRNLQPACWECNRVKRDNMAPPVDGLLTLF